MVPEWQEAYLDYNSLKNILKDVLNVRRNMQSNSPQATAVEGSALRRRVSLYRAFSGLTGRNRAGEEEEAILVSSVKEHGSSEARYQTMFLMSTEEGGGYEHVFFNRLDSEFNKVVRFYQKKVQEVMEEADELTRQMNALIALRVKVEKPNVRSTGNHVPVSEFSYDPPAHPLRSKKTGEGTILNHFLNI